MWTRSRTKDKRVESKVEGETEDNEEAEKDKEDTNDHDSDEAGSSTSNKGTSKAKRRGNYLSRERKAELTTFIRSNFWFSDYKVAKELEINHKTVSKHRDKIMSEDGFKFPSKPDEYKVGLSSGWYQDATLPGRQGSQLTTERSDELNTFIRQNFWFGDAAIAKQFDVAHTSVRHRRVKIMADEAFTPPPKPVEYKYGQKMGWYRDKTELDSPVNEAVASSSTSNKGTSKAKSKPIGLSRERKDDLTTFIRSNFWFSDYKIAKQLNIGDQKTVSKHRDKIMSEDGFEFPTKPDEYKVGLSSGWYQDATLPFRKGSQLITERSDELNNFIRQNFWFGDRRIGEEFNIATRSIERRRIKIIAEEGFRLPPKPVGYRFGKMKGWYQDKTETDSPVNEPLASSSTTSTKLPSGKQKLSREARRNEKINSVKTNFWMNNNTIATIGKMRNIVVKRIRKDLLADPNFEPPEEPPGYGIGVGWYKLESTEKSKKVSTASEKKKKSKQVQNQVQEKVVISHPVPVLQPSSSKDVDVSLIEDEQQLKGLDVILKKSAVIDKFTEGFGFYGPADQKAVIPEVNFARNRVGNSGILEKVKNYCDTQNIVFVDKNHSSFTSIVIDSARPAIEIFETMCVRTKIHDDIFWDPITETIVSLTSKEALCQHPTCNLLVDFFEGASLLCKEHGEDWYTKIIILKDFANDIEALAVTKFDFRVKNKMKEERRNALILNNLQKTVFYSRYKALRKSMGKSVEFKIWKMSKDSLAVASGVVMYHTMKLALFTRSLGMWSNELVHTIVLNSSVLVESFSVVAFNDMLYKFGSHLTIENVDEEETTSEFSPCCCTMVPTNPANSRWAYILSSRMKMIYIGDNPGDPNKSRKKSSKNPESSIHSQLKDATTWGQYLRKCLDKKEDSRVLFSYHSCNVQDDSVFGSFHMLPIDFEALAHLVYFYRYLLKGQNEFKFTMINNELKLCLSFPHLFDILFKFFEHEFKLKLVINYDIQKDILFTNNEVNVL